MTPGFKIRAVQLDLARQMETTDFICRFIDFIAAQGYNTLFLYLEWRVRTRTFDIGSEQGYSAAEMTAIIEYAGQLKLERSYPDLPPEVHASTRVKGSRRFTFLSNYGNTDQTFEFAGQTVELKSLDVKIITETIQ